MAASTITPQHAQKLLLSHVRGIAFVDTPSVTELVKEHKVDVNMPVAGNDNVLTFYLRNSRTEVNPALISELLDNGAGVQPDALRLAEGYLRNLRSCQQTSVVAVKIEQFSAVFEVLKKKPISQPARVPTLSA